jgi:hypothetical protein
VVDTRFIDCGDNLDHLAKLPLACIDLVYPDPSFNSNRNYEAQLLDAADRKRHSLSE